MGWRGPGGVQAQGVGEAPGLWSVDLTSWLVEPQGTRHCGPRGGGTSGSCRSGRRPWLLQGGTASGKGWASQSHLGILKRRLLGLSSKISDSVGLEWAGNFGFLTTTQVILMMVVRARAEDQFPSRFNPRCTSESPQEFIPPSFFQN